MYLYSVVSVLHLCFCVCVCVCVTLVAPIISAALSPQRQVRFSINTPTPILPSSPPAAATHQSRPSLIPLYHVFMSFCVCGAVIGSLMNN